MIAGTGAGVGGGGGEQAREPKVGDLGLAAVGRQQDVVRLDVCYSRHSSRVIAGTLGVLSQAL